MTYSAQTKTFFPYPYLNLEFEIILPLKCGHPKDILYWTHLHL